MPRSLVKIHTDKVPKLVRLSNTQVQLPAGIAPISLTITTSITGVGGLDTGSVAASTFYYVYLVNGISLVASTSSVSPGIPFTNSRKVGAFYTDSSSNIFKAYYFGEINQTVLSAYFIATGTASAQTPINWVQSSTNSGGLLTINFISGIFSLEPRLVGNRAGSGGGTVATVATGGTNLSITLSQGNTSSNPHQAFVQKQGIDAVQPDWSL
jgi:hypothetical protein